MCDGSRGVEHIGPIVVAEDRDDDHLLRRDPRWKPQPAVVAVRYHDAATSRVLAPHEVVYGYCSLPSRAV
jgi:hypothetical protein